MSALQGGLRPSAKKIETAKEKAIAAMSEIDAVEMQRLSINIPKNLHKSFKTRCVVNDVQMNIVVAELIEKYLADITK